MAAVALVVYDLATVMVHDLATVAVVHGPRLTRTSDPTAWEGGTAGGFGPLDGHDCDCFLSAMGAWGKLYKPTS